MLRRGAKKTHERKFVTVDRAAPHKGRAEDSASLGPAQSRGGPIDGVDPASRGLGVLQRRQEDKRLSGRRVLFGLSANPERRQAHERREMAEPAHGLAFAQGSEHLRHGQSAIDDDPGKQSRAR